MIRYGSGPSKATASTLCQKCLKRGHYSYECKAQAQDRPYISRPSRTQQLLNPKLVPQLTSDVPNDLLRKKGVADEQLAKRAAERGRKRSRDGNIEALPARKRSRSVSSYSSDSVSTISTTVSRSPPPRRARISKDDEYYTSQREELLLVPRDVRGEKRRRRFSSSSSDSYRSDGPYLRDHATPARDRNTRPRRGSTSPANRGRRTGRSASWDARRRQKSRSGSTNRGRGVRHRRSPSDEHQGYRGNRGTRGSRSRSPYRAAGRRGQHGATHGPERNGRRSNDAQQPPRPAAATQARHAAPPPPPRERSLSPFSKRLALTQAMNMSAG
ncbi:zinc knuckle-domain-containing protein [Cryomyces antarcticus]